MLGNRDVSGGLPVAVSHAHTHAHSAGQWFYALADVHAYARTTATYITAAYGCATTAHGCTATATYLQAAAATAATAASAAAAHAHATSADTHGYATPLAT